MSFVYQTDADLPKAFLGVFVICLLLGLIFTKWPEKVQKHDTRMALYIKDPANHKAFIKGVGYFLLMFSVAALLMAFSSFFG